MVTNVTSLTGNGLRDWLVQRVTAIYFAFFSLLVLGFILLHPNMAYMQWKALFQCTLFKIAALMALAALSLHAWIGIWTVTTDYLKCLYVRLFAQVVVLAWLIGQFIWGLMIVWGQ